VSAKVGMQVGSTAGVVELDSNRSGSGHGAPMTLSVSTLDRAAQAKHRIKTSRAGRKLTAENERSSLPTNALARSRQGGRLETPLLRQPSQARPGQAGPRRPSPQRMPRRPGEVRRMAELAIKFEPFGPEPAAIDRMRAALLRSPSLHDFLGEVESRLLTFELVDKHEKKHEEPAAPDSYRATFFDYTNNRTVIAEAPLDESVEPQLFELGTQPLPSPEEFEAAVEIVRDDSERSPRLGLAAAASASPTTRPVARRETATTPNTSRSHEVVARVVRLGVSTNLSTVRSFSTVTSSSGTQRT
jgi:hypothetical protein